MTKSFSISTPVSMVDKGTKNNFLLYKDTWICTSRVKITLNIWNGVNNILEIFQVKINMF